MGCAGENMAINKHTSTPFKGLTIRKKRQDTLCIQCVSILMLERM